MGLSEAGVLAVGKPVPPVATPGHVENGRARSDFAEVSKFCLTETHMLWKMKKGERKARRRDRRLCRQFCPGGSGHGRFRFGSPLQSRRDDKPIRTPRNAGLIDAGEANQMPGVGGSQF